MKLKRSLAWLLTLVLAMALFAVPASAVDNSRSFSFTLDVDGKTAIDAKTGDVITVNFHLKRTDKDESWPMYAWQTEIAYDSSAFELVEGSVKAADGVTSSLHRSGRLGLVYFNDYSMSKGGTTYPAELGVCSFQLRVTGSGDYAIRCTNSKVSTSDGMDVYAMRNEDITVSVGGTKASERFVDVPAGSWYEEAVGFVVDRGLFAGTSATTFTPNGGMTRGMLVTVLWRLEGKPVTATVNGFSDVAAGKWYTDAVVWANANQIVLGYGNGRFGPDDLVTREQMAAILMRYSRFKGYDISQRADISGYVDFNRVGSWAVESMQWANAGGIITGTSATTLTPQGTATRAQVAVMLMRFVNKFSV